MLALGKRYGMALQLINVLRDAGSDLRAGRCYFPEFELSAAHFTPSQILSEPERFQPIYRAWLEKAKAGLECGMQYSAAIQNRRVRAATVLQRTVKVPRREVRTMVLALAITFASRNSMDATFNLAKL
jgi:farnesyl-diphosphate farnesyltransferase